MTRFRSIRLLFVEDNTDDIEIARRALRASDAVGDVRLARDGQEAVEALLEGAAGADEVRPDIIILDLNLPRMNGFEVLERLRASEEYRATPVVVFTASARHEDVLRAYRLGANSYIQKPAVFERFGRLLETWSDYWLDAVTLPS